MQVKDKEPVAKSKTSHAQKSMNGQARARSLPHANLPLQLEACPCTCSMISKETQNQCATHKSMLDMCQQCVNVAAIAHFITTLVTRTCVMWTSMLHTCVQSYCIQGPRHTMCTTHAAKGITQGTLCTCDITAPHGQGNTMHCI